MAATALQQHSSAEDYRWYATAWALVSWIALAKLILHLATATRYGFFRDEMYFLACGERLDWGYVDMPPLIGAIAWFVHNVLGTSLFAVRLLPALAGAAVVLLAGAIARELGAGRFGMVLAAFSTLFAGIYLVMHHLFTMNAFDPLIWMSCAWVLARIVRTGNQKLWLLFGVFAGLGVNNKYAMGVFLASLVLGVLLTRQRQALAHRWIWIGGAIAVAMFLPNIIWNIRHGWPFFELIHNVRVKGLNTEVGPVKFLIEQIFIMNPFTFPVWFGGLLYVFFSREGKRYAPLGWGFAGTIAFFLLAKGKNYYPTPVYPMMFAAGAVAIERYAITPATRWIKPALMVLILAFTAVLLPMMVPVLSIESYLKYQQKLPIPLPKTEKSHELSPLPQYYADSFGWEEMVAAVAKAYNSLPAEERAKAAIFANNFGEGGAVDLFGPKYGLPKAIGNQQNYFLWGPRGYTGEVIIVLGDRYEVLKDKCREVQVAAELHHPYAEPWENKPVLVCKGLKWDLREIWPKMKHYD